MSFSSTIINKILTTSMSSSIIFLITIIIVQLINASPVAASSSEHQQQEQQQYFTIKCKPSVNHSTCDMKNIRTQKNTIIWVPPEEDEMLINKIKIYNSELEVMPDKIFITFPKLNILQIVSSGLQKIRIIDFLHGKYLYYLDLSNNNIRHLEMEQFRYTKNLEYIDLSENEIQFIDSITFSVKYVAYLRYLDLSNNKLKIIGNRFLFDSLKLEWLDLHGNQIDVLEEFTFKFWNTKWPKLRFIDLSNNNIKKLYNGMFSELKELTYLYLQNNQLNNIDKIFQDLYALRWIDVSSNNIQTIEENAFINLKNLQGLTLRKNQLKYLPANLFEMQQENLNYLDLSFNKFNNINSDINYRFSLVHTLEQLKQLEILYLNDNQINTIDLLNIKLRLPSLKLITKMPYWKCKNLSKYFTNLNDSEQLMLQFSIDMLTIEKCKYAQHIIERLGDVEMDYFEQFNNDYEENWNYL